LSLYEGGKEKSRRGNHTKGFEAFTRRGGKNKKETLAGGWGRASNARQRTYESSNGREKKGGPKAESVS